MKYFLANPQLDSQISEIRRKIRLSMNGIVSDQMKQHGIIYKKNFGVSVPRIKEIALGYQPDEALAQRLWALQIRETMIMATLLYPVERFTAELANEWAAAFNQIEIVEQCCLNLFSKTVDAPVLALDWIESDSHWLQVAGFNLAARLYEKFDDEQSLKIIRRAVDISDTEHFHVYKSIATCLSRFCRKTRNTGLYIAELMHGFELNSTVGQQFIVSEVNQEIIFLEIL